MAGLIEDPEDITAPEFAGLLAALGRLAGQYYQ